MDWAAAFEPFVFLTVIVGVFVAGAVVLSLRQAYGSIGGYSSRERARWHNAERVNVPNQH